jgi:hypothetical protein
VVVPSYLKWSKEAITFDHNDHLDYIPNPRSYPLIVDPIITKVLMDGGSGLNILYTEMFDLMGINGLGFKLMPCCSTAWFRGSKPTPSDRLTYLSVLGLLTNSKGRPSPLTWSGYEERTTQS